MAVPRSDYSLSQLEVLEAESIHIMREVAAEFERPVLLFSGGKDSIVMLALAERAFWPARIPFPVMHVDTGHNFPEVIDYRDRRVAEAGVKLVVASVQDSIDAGRVAEETGRRASRNRLQTTTLLDAIEENRFDAVFGGGRRDEEKARAKERVFSFRDEFGQWDPKNQRPELWSIYNTRIRMGEHIRVFPLSNWTELDVWQYIAREKLEIPSIYFAHQRRVFERDGILLAENEFTPRGDDEPVFETTVRYRTVGDMTVHRGGGIHRHDGVRRDRRGRGHPDHRARPDPRGRPGQRGGHGRPQAGGLLLNVRHHHSRSPAHRGGQADGHPAAGHGRLGRRRQEHPDRAPAVRLEGDLRGPARGRRADQQGPRRGLHQPGPAHRRPARRAGAGHHDRRGLPLFRHAAPEVHHRGHPGPHPVHPEHGHRGVHRRPGHRPGGRAQRADRAEPAARVPHHAAPGAAPGPGGQQDGPGRLRPGRVRADQ